MSSPFAWFLLYLILFRFISLLHFNSSFVLKPSIQIPVFLTPFSFLTSLPPSSLLLTPPFPSHPHPSSRHFHFPSNPLFPSLSQSLLFHLSLLLLISIPKQSNRPKITPLCHFLHPFTILSYHLNPITGPLILQTKRHPRSRENGPETLHQSASR